MPDIMPRWYADISHVEYITYDDNFRKLEFSHGDDVIRAREAIFTFPNIYLVFYEQFLYLKLHLIHKVY